MKINYDTVADTMYLRLRKGKVAKTIRMKDRVIVDINKKGDVMGIEILDASTQQDIKTLEESVKNGVPIEITSYTPVLA